MAPFFTDIDISFGIGQIIYAVYNDTIPEGILSSVNSVINEHMLTDFKAEWLLVATWENVPEFGSGSSNVRSQYSILITYSSIPISIILSIESDKYIPGDTSN